MLGPYTGSDQQSFQAVVFGGSDVIPVLGTRAAVAARPASQLGLFAFPRIAGPPARVVGGADVIVMLKDSPAARSLITYPATPAAATVWAKRGGFLSPNGKVNVDAYPLAGSRTMATQITATTKFRLDLGGLEPTAFRSKLSSLLHAHVRSPGRAAAISLAGKTGAPAWGRRPRRLLPHGRPICSSSGLLGVFRTCWTSNAHVDNGQLCTDM